MSIYKEPIEWIKLSIESVLNQTYPNMEYVIVLDNPNHYEAKEYIKDLVRRQFNITFLINEKNLGLVQSLNKGLLYCSGDFVARMDADDISLPDRIERQLLYLEKHKLDVIGCGIELFDEYHTTRKRSIVHKFSCRFNVRYYTCLAHPSWIVKKSVYDSLKGYRNIDTCEDFDFLNRAINCGYSIGNYPEVLLRYRLNNNSISHTKYYKQYATMRFLSNYYRKRMIPSVDMLNKYLSEKPGVEYILESEHIFESEKNYIKQHSWIKRLLLFKYNIYRKQVYYNRITQFMSVIDRLASFVDAMYDKSRPNLRKIKRVLLNIRDEAFLKVKTNKKSNSKSIYLIGTEDFGNLGDQQIAVSILEFLKSNYSYPVIEINATEYYNKRFWLLRHINANDIIVMTGGGNFGNVYYGAQLMRRDIIHFWKSNPKIIMPVTIYYDDSKEGREFKNKDKSYFINENNIILVTREEKSYDIAKSEFSCDILLTPDIVLYSSYPSEKIKKDRALICIRNDLESNLSRNDKSIIKKDLMQYFENIYKTDTQKNYLIPRQLREQEMDGCLTLFKKVNLVVTDRLHGMIFSTITSTPCIVFGNYNYKILESYKWIKEQGYIKFANNLEELRDILDTQFWKNTYCYNPDVYSIYFDKIKDKLDFYIEHEQGRKE